MVMAGYQPRQLIMTCNIEKKYILPDKFQVINFLNLKTEIVFYVFETKDYQRALFFLRHKKVKSSQNYYQSAFTCSKLTKETLEQGVKYVQG